MKEAQLPYLFERTAIIVALMTIAIPRDANKAIRGEALESVRSHELLCINSTTRGLVIGGTPRKQGGDDEQSSISQVVLQVGFHGERNDE